MEANEMMLNDLVYMRWYKCSNTEKWYIDKVKNLNNNGLLEYKPILLTIDILKANGFDGHYLWLKEGETNGDTEYVEMELTKEGSMFFFIRRTWNNGQFKGVLKYVHELQHALRLCGLYELADNFKLR